VAFATAILHSVYLAPHPTPIDYSNVRLLMGFVEEAIALALFLVVFKRQNRRLQELGFDFRWTDLLKGVGLAFAGLSAMFAMFLAISSVYYMRTHQLRLDSGPRSNFSSCSIWFILPFLLLNPFFEEMLVRGYLMTELIGLRKSVVLATVVSLAVQTSYHLYYGVLGAVMVGAGLSVFAIYYAKSRRLMPVILGHMFWDFCTVYLKLHHP
jgi:membrane protease YdiL (CAAX protease family)